jgi:hypothetical protein
MVAAVHVLTIQAFHHFFRVLNYAPKLGLDLLNAGLCRQERAAKPSTRGSGAGRMGQQSQTSKRYVSRKFAWIVT